MATVDARSVADIVSTIGTARERWRVFGLRAGARPFLVARLAAETRGAIVVVASTSADAEGWAADLRFFLGEGEERTPLERRVHVFPAWDTEPLSGVSPTGEIVGERLFTLCALG